MAQCDLCIFNEGQLCQGPINVCGRCLLLILSSKTQNIYTPISGDSIGLVKEEDIPLLTTTMELFTYSETYNLSYLLLVKTLEIIYV